MKRVVMLALMFAVSTTYAATEASGKIVFMKGENVSGMPATLVIDGKGKDAEFSVKIAKETYVADKVFINKRAGRHVMTMVFHKAKHMKGGTIVSRGTVMKGKNMGIYYGDSFVVHRKKGGHEDLYDAIENDTLGLDHHHHRVQHLGGFAFKKEFSEK